MAFYRTDYFNRDGKKVSSIVAKYPSNVGRWQQNKILDKKDGYKSSYRSVPTKSGLNRKVVTYTSYNLKDGSKVVTRLITNRSSYKKYK